MYYLSHAYLKYDASVNKNYTGDDDDKFDDDRDDNDDDGDEIDDYNNDLVMFTKCT